MQVQLPSAASAHWPFSTMQSAPGGQKGTIRHEPPHVAPPHWGVGVARGDGWTGTQSQLPFALVVHRPCSSMPSSDPLQMRPSGQGIGGLMTQVPPHG
jgi:hypothetical protein